MRRLLALVLLTPALLGCLGGSDDALDPSAADAASEVPKLPTGCDGNRSTVAHHADAAPPDEASGTALIPCLTGTGLGGAGEPTIGIATDGVVFTGRVHNGEVPGTFGIARSDDQGASWEFLGPDVAGGESYPLALDAEGDPSGVTRSGTGS